MFQVKVTRFRTHPRPLCDQYMVPVKITMIQKLLDSQGMTEKKTQTMTMEPIRMSPPVGGGGGGDKKYVENELQHHKIQALGTFVSTLRAYTGPHCIPNAYFLTK